eukprot:CAMPEP_0183388644 /NCGR_PEP_ID=MMETSP0370-20130417/4263_1 /TAXON_ID=268820 /ORGANISM="Peridinium aciculiferum, Strain PAER-2" /LENGTH=246 /DNA_ID=CAMNT_0025567641 /DNA_START=35 /DNA_END=773 /DNA_ORIENTATION=-
MRRASSAPKQQLGLCNAATDDGVFDTLPPYLGKFGYLAESGAEGTHWKGDVSEATLQAHPQLEIHVTGHAESEGHTQYLLHCSLSVSGVRRLDWPLQKRLRILREELHCPIKEQLSPEIYEQYFGRTPFAHKGGFPGTTARLDSWCSALAECTNARGCSPGMVAMVLNVLEAPEPRSAKDAAKSAASSVADRFRNAARTVKTKVEQAPQQAQQKLEQAALGYAARNPQAALGMASKVAKTASMAKW